jgi:hypothetical protein
LCGLSLSAATVATGGVAEDWVNRDPACPPGSQRAACSIRFGGAFSYTVPTAAGRSYRLRFTFSEVYWGAAGQRLFDVLVNGAAVLTNVDPYALAGAKFIPVVREVTVTATGPTMVVSMRTRLDNAALAALEVSATHLLIYHITFPKLYDANIRFSLCVHTHMYLTSDCHNFGWWMDWLDALSVSTHMRIHKSHKKAAVAAPA